MGGDVANAPMYCTTRKPLSTPISTMNLTRGFDRFDIRSVAFILEITGAESFCERS